MKRQFLMLSHVYEDQPVSGWYVSEKMDGLRVYWDGGISRGLPVTDVPYANIERDYRLVNQNYLATGLWSRNGKVMRCPEWFLDHLPSGVCLDGEIYGGRGKWELTSSIVKDHIPNELAWQQIKYQVFDTPCYDQVFTPGMVETDNYTMTFNQSILDWISDRIKIIGGVKEPDNRQFNGSQYWLRQQNIENDYVRLIEQTQLSMIPKEYEEYLSYRMQAVIDNGGEGLMLRQNYSYWTPERSHQLLKMKRWYDAEGVVSGYSWGRKTKKGSRHLGRMGALVVQWDGKTFEISGFADDERLLVYGDTRESAHRLGEQYPGERVNKTIINPLFPPGTIVTFRYRELTGAGIPKSAIYLRKAVNQ